MQSILGGMDRLRAMASDEELETAKKQSLTDHPLAPTNMHRMNHTSAHEEKDEANGGDRGHLLASSLPASQTNENSVAASSTSVIVTPAESSSTSPINPHLHITTNNGSSSPHIVTTSVNSQHLHPPSLHLTPSPYSSTSPQPSSSLYPTRSSSPSPSPPPAPSWFFQAQFGGCERLADYFLVLGRINDNETPLVPMRKLSRSNSQTIQPISDVVVVLSDKLKDVPPDFTRIQDFGSHDIDVNPGMLRTPVYLAESRLPRRRGSSVILPITGLDVINIDRKETPKDGWTQLPGNLNARSLRSNLALCIERSTHKSPLIDIKVVCVPGGVKAIEAAVKWYATNATSTESDEKAASPITFPPHIHNPFTIVVPNEYIRVDQSINASKDLFLVYKTAKRRAVEYMSYEPFLVDRYPEVDRKGFPLETQGVSMLCFPRGMLLKSEPSLPNFMTFVLTQASGNEIYGASLIFYELLPNDPTSVPMAGTNSTSSSRGDTIGGEISPSDVTVTTSEQQPQLQFQPMWCPRCLCLLSHYPFYDLFKTFLNQLYRIAVSPSQIPLERFIGHFFHEIPVPRPYLPNVHYTIGHARTMISLPPVCGLPFKNFSLLTLFRCLSIENIVLLFEHILSEGKVVFYSNSHAILTPVAESIRCLLYPMRWQCVFIPILPTNLAYTVRAPVPFIIGLHRSFLDELQVPKDVFLVDLDRNQIRMPDNIIPHHEHSYSGVASETDTSSISSASFSSTSSSSSGSGGSSHHNASEYRNSDIKMLYPFPDYLKDFLTVELSDLTSPTSATNAANSGSSSTISPAASLLYQTGQDLSVYSDDDNASGQSASMMFDMDFHSMDPLQIEMLELKLRLVFLKVQIMFLGDYRKFICLRPEESDSFFDLDVLFDRKAFAKSFLKNGDDQLYTFARQLSESQMFSSFILNRVVTPKNDQTTWQTMVFFDYCVALQKEGFTGTPYITVPTSIAQTNANIPPPTPTSLQQALSSTNLLAPSSSTVHHVKTQSEFDFDVKREQAKFEELKQRLKKRLSKDHPLHPSSSSLTSSSSSTAAATSLFHVRVNALNELVHSGSLTWSTLEAIKNLPPSLIPMPHDWMKLVYEVPNVTASDEEQEPTGGKGVHEYRYESFPSLDVMKFGEYGNTTSPAAVTTSSSTVGATTDDKIIQLRLTEPKSPNHNLKWLIPEGMQSNTHPHHQPKENKKHPQQPQLDSHQHPNHPGNALSVIHPNHHRTHGNGASHNRRGTEIEAYDLALVSNAHARSRILISLFTHLNQLHDRMRTWSGHDKTVLPSVQLLYELHFSMFTASCESERERKRRVRRRRIREGTYYPITLLATPVATPNSTSNETTPQTSPMDGPPHSSSAASSPAPATASTPSATFTFGESVLRAEEHREALVDLLTMLISLHSMVSRGGVLPTERILEDISIFCLKMNLITEFQEVYKLFSTSVPHLSTRFFAQLIQIGIMNPLTNPNEILLNDGAIGENGLIDPALIHQLQAPLGSSPLLAPRLSTFSARSTSEEATPSSYIYPSSITTYAMCTTCSYELSGEEILVGWMIHAADGRLDTSCPLCDRSVSAQLVIRLPDQAHEIRVDFMKPSSLRSSLNALTLLKRSTELQTLQQSSTAADISREDYLPALRTSPELFWNLFWFFVTRGPRTRGNGGDHSRSPASGSGHSTSSSSSMNNLGALPYHFLFCEDNEVLGRVTTNYQVDVSPYKPWSIQAEEEDGLRGSSGSVGVNGLLSPMSPSGGNGDGPNASGDVIGRDRTISWDTIDQMRSAANSIDASSGLPETIHENHTPAPVTTSTSPATSANSVASLLHGLLDGADHDQTHRVTFADDDHHTQMMKGDGFQLESVSPPTASASSTSGKEISPDERAQQNSISPPTESVSSTATLDDATLEHSRRRSSLSFSNVQYIMTHVQSRPLHQAIRTILRGRWLRKQWTPEERREDERFFQSSMYQNLARLMSEALNENSQTNHTVPATLDPISFVSEYKQALSSLDATIEAHKKAIEQLEAASHNIIQSAGLTALPLAAHTHTALTGLDSEASQVLELKRKKKELTMLALEEAVAMKAELLPCDSVPLTSSITMLSSVRKLFGCELHRSILRSSTHARAGSITMNASGTGILDDLLVHEVPPLEDVLTQVSQNPHYTLNGFMHFAASFRTHQELVAMGGGSRSHASSSADKSSTPLQITPLHAPTPVHTNPTNQATGHSTSTVALSYVRLWGSIRRWRVKYERNDRHRSLSIVVKNPLNPLLGSTHNDSVFDSARAIYDRFLITQAELDANASNANTPASSLNKSASPDSNTNGITMLPLPQENRSRRTSSVGERKGSLAPIAEGKSELTISTVDSSTTKSDATPSSTDHHPPPLNIETPHHAQHPSPPPVSSTPMVGGALTTIRGIVLPRPLHEHIRRVLTEQIRAEHVDPLMHTTVETFVHHSVPKFLFDDVASVVLNWLKKHVYPPYLEEVRREEQEEEEQREAELKAAQEAEAAKELDRKMKEALELAASKPPIPPRPTARTTSETMTANATSVPPPVDRSKKPLAAITTNSTPASDSKPAVPNAREEIALESPDSAFVKASSREVESPEWPITPQPDSSTSPAQIQFHADTPDASVIETLKIGSSSPPKSSPSSPLAPMPLLHNVSGDSLTLAKQGAHKPDYSHANGDELP